MSENNITASVATALEAEHRQIDAGIEEYAKGGQESCLITAIEALRRHIWLEEELLFPRLVEHGLQMPVFVMEREHAELWTLMDSLSAQLANKPARTTETCQKMLALLDNHNSKEEPILYPHAEEALGTEDTLRFHGFINSGTLPEGWTPKRVSN